MSDFQQWWASQPLVTKYLLVGCLSVTLAGNFGILQPQNLILIPKLVFQQFQIWRLVTCFLFLGRLGFPFLIDLIFLYRYCSMLETTTFDQRTGDFVWMILLGMGSLLIVGICVPFVLLGKPLIFMLLYYWSRKNPDAMMSFFFGITFKGIYLPWVLMGFTMLMGGSPWLDLLGVVAGHVYYFLDEVYPTQLGGPRFIKTPQFIHRLVPPEINRYRPQQQGAPRQQAAEPRQQGEHNWGRGYVLGGR